MLRNTFFGAIIRCVISHTACSMLAALLLEVVMVAHRFEVHGSKFEEPAEEGRYPHVCSTLRRRHLAGSSMVQRTVIEMRAWVSWPFHFCPDYDRNARVVASLGYLSAILRTTGPDLVSVRLQSTCPRRVSVCSSSL
jgi:hypothetical protein